MTDLVKVADAALEILEQFYPHEAQKRHRYHTLPIMAIRSLREELLAGNIDEVSFNSRMFKIFSELKDNHTRYRVDRAYYKTLNIQGVKGPYRVPFTIEKAHNDLGLRCFVVSNIDSGAQICNLSFQVGVEVTHWNDVPIEDAIRINAEQYWGATDEAFDAQGLRYLTLRPTDLSVRPAEDRVRIRFQAADQSEQEAEFCWQEAGGEGGSIANLGSINDSQLALDQVGYRAQQIQKDFNNSGSQQELRVLKRRANYYLAKYGSGAEQLAYVRLWNFNAPNPNKFIRDFVTDLEQAPRRGLIIDIRGNPGGMIKASELLLQLFTPNTIEPTLFQFANSAGARRLIESSGTFSKWRSQEGSTLLTWETHSVARPIFDSAEINGIGQVYFGPVVLIIDALTYSAADMFAASFQDHNIGTILGVDKRTGGGGSNLWSWSRIRTYLPDERFSLDRGERTELRKLISEPVQPLKEKYRAWLVSKLDADITARLKKITGPVSIERDYLSWIGLDSNGEAFFRALYIPKLFKDVHLLLRESELPEGIRIPFSIRRSLRQGSRSGIPLEDVGVRADVEYQMSVRDVVESNAGLLDKAASLIDERLIKILHVYRSDDGQPSLLVRGFHDIVVCEDGFPVQTFDNLRGATRVKRLKITDERKEILILAYRDRELVARKLVNRKEFNRQLGSN